MNKLKASNAETTAWSLIPLSIQFRRGDKCSFVLGVGIVVSLAKGAGGSEDVAMLKLS
jgi:hypothetical protein